MNEHRRRTLGAAARRRIVYMCECADAACLAAVVLDADEFDRLRRSERPILVAGHPPEPASVDGSVR